MTLMLARLFAGALVCAPIAVAQTYFTVPPGLLDEEVSPAAVTFGEFPDMRFQIIDWGDLRGPSRVAEIAMRRDGYREASPNYFLGRSWSNVELVMSEGAASPMTAFSMNLASNTTQVFSASVSWPDHSSGPKTSVPHTWATDVAFPFSVPWSYSGNQSRVASFTFRGGVLKGQPNWKQSSRYYLDGVAPANQAYNAEDAIGDPYSAWLLCRPRGFTTTCYVEAITEVKSQRVGLNVSVLDYHLSASVIAAISLTGDRVGVAIGDNCQRYYLGAGPLMALQGVRTPSTYQGGVSVTSGSAPYRSDYVGLRLTGQAAFLNNPAYQLTRAGAATIQAMPLSGYLATTLRAPSATATQGELWQQSLPVLRYRRL